MADSGKRGLGDIEAEPTSTRRTLIGVSTDTNTERATRSVLEQVNARAAAVTLLFFSPQYDENVVARILDEHAGSRGLGGSTAGELSAAGFMHGGMVAFSISTEVARAAVRAIGNVETSSLVPFRSLAGDLAERLDLEVDDLDPDRHMWLGLFDGLGSREEMIVPFFARHSAGIPLVGGSLGDEERMERVSLVHDGQVHRNAVAIVLLEYDGHFSTLQQTHHKLTDVSFEVTEVGQGGRLLKRLDGRPALDVFADAMGVEPIDVDERLTGSHPFGRRFKGRPFPCSIMRRYDDGSLLLAYGVQVGDTLTLLEPGDLVVSTDEALTEAILEFEKRAGHKPESMLTFHCLGRYREATRRGEVSQLFEALHKVPIVGFNSYGEQYGSLHMNHSLLAVLFG